jgi:hypothetical protein
LALACLVLTAGTASAEMHPVPTTLQAIQQPLSELLDGGWTIVTASTGGSGEVLILTDAPKQHWIRCELFTPGDQLRVSASASVGSICQRLN